ncbi:hypothetical protein ACFL27_10505 [candidate division CSSED10-310 bacterium]|uniref:Uncharacterized protein n=1 Tax=candidate division CSSED10-310 bacterium TaxID=2855610 RepID=A0ABV6YWM5_UNCC1
MKDYSPSTPYDQRLSNEVETSAHGPFDQDADLTLDRVGDIYRIIYILKQWDHLSHQFKHDLEQYLRSPGFRN